MAVTHSRDFNDTIAQTLQLFFSNKKKYCELTAFVLRYLNVAGKKKCFCSRWVIRRCLVQVLGVFMFVWVFFFFFTRSTYSIFVCFVNRAARLWAPEWFVCSLLSLTAGTEWGSSAEMGNQSCCIFVFMNAGRKAVAKQWHVDSCLFFAVFLLAVAETFECL